MAERTMNDPTKDYTPAERQHLEMLRKHRERLEKRDQERKEKAQK